MQDAVVSSLAIHHLDSTEKQVLFKDVASILAPSLDLDGDLRGYDYFCELGWNHYAHLNPIQIRLTNRRRYLINSNGLNRLGSLMSMYSG